MVEKTEHATMILGEVASSGVARGQAFVCACACQRIAVPQRKIDEDEAQKEIEKLDAAIAVAEGNYWFCKKRFTKPSENRKLRFLGHISCFYTIQCYAMKLALFAL